MRKPVVLITGAAGEIGHALIDHLVADGGRAIITVDLRPLEPVLDAMGITYHLLETEADVAKIKPAIDAAYAKPEPLVLLIGRRPDAS